MTAKDTFRGSGRALNAEVSDEEQKKAGAGFRRKAGSKRAREERALAAERRLRALHGEGLCAVLGAPLYALVDVAHSWTVKPGANGRA